MDKIRSYKDLNIWNKGITIVEEIYTITKKFPEEERYSLVLQMRKAAVSIPSNIAEGFARQHDKEYKYFLYIALGSCSELITQLIISFKLKYIESEKQISMENDLDYLSKMIMSLIKKIR